MNLILTALTEVWGLFVDDGLLALGLVIWCAVTRWALPAIAAPQAIRAPLLFVGCLLILIVDVLITARRRRTATLSANSRATL
jgi:hypothetical protein